MSPCTGTCLRRVIYHTVPRTSGTVTASERESTDQTTMGLDEFSCIECIECIGEYGVFHVLTIGIKHHQFIHHSSEWALTTYRSLGKVGTFWVWYCIVVWYDMIRYGTEPVLGAAAMTAGWSEQDLPWPSSEHTWASCQAAAAHSPVNPVFRTRTETIRRTKNRMGEMGSKLRMGRPQISINFQPPSFDIAGHAGLSLIRTRLAPLFSYIGTTGQRGFSHVTWSQMHQ